MEDMKENPVSPQVRFNAFTSRLTAFMMANHPERIDDVAFIEARGEYAAAIFEQSSRAGTNVTDAMAEAEAALYKGLQFSPYLTVKDVLIYEFGYKAEDSETDEFAMQMLHTCRSVFGKYETDDAFMGTYGYCELYNKLTESINQYMHNNGLQ